MWKLRRPAVRMLWGFLLVSSTPPLISFFPVQRKDWQHICPEPVAATPVPPAEPEMSLEEKLAYLRQRAADWKPAKRLGTLRETMVFAVGNPRARLMLVGEAPGYEEERQGEPFVGPAGQLLTKILGAMGLQRGDVYISNVCKFRPSMGENQGTANRAPSPEELAACSPLIMAEIRAIP